jgi:hypothetical protein
MSQGRAKKERPHTPSGVPRRHGTLVVTEIERGDAARDQATEHGKRVLLGGANIVAGFLDFMQGLADGDEPGEAFDKAYERTKKRKAAIKRSSEE